MFVGRTLSSTAGTDPAQATTRPLPRPDSPRGPCVLRGFLPLPPACWVAALSHVSGVCLNSCAPSGSSPFNITCPLSLQPRLPFPLQASPSLSLTLLPRPPFILVSQGRAGWGATCPPGVSMVRARKQACVRGAGVTGCQEVNPTAWVGRLLLWLTERLVTSLHPQLSKVGVRQHSCFSRWGWASQASQLNILIRW